MAQFQCRLVQEQEPETLMLEGSFLLANNNSWKNLITPAEASTDGNNGITFERGFSINEELSSLLPLAIFPNNRLDDSPLVSVGPNNPEQVRSLAQRVPIIKTKPSDFPAQNISDDDYSYLLYTYKVANPPSNMDSKEMQFIFTGSPDMKAGSFVTKNVFIPLKELEKRLGVGDYTREQRREAYLQDWLTYVAYIMARNKKAKKEPLVPKDIPRYTIPPLEANPLMGLEDRFNGAHLSVRDTAGQFKHEETVHFLTNLLTPSNDDKIGEHLGRYIFARWCRVAYVAAIAAKEPYSVKARFWAIPKTIKQKIEFIYAKPWQLTQHGSSVLKDSVFFKKGNANEQAEIIQKLTLLAGAWEDVMKAAHTEVDGDLKTTSLLGYRFRTETESNTTDWETEHVLLGEHPQGFFSTWVSKAHADEMKSWKYDLQERLFPGSRNPLTTDPAILLLLASDAPITRTRITKTRLDNAGNWPRCCSQNAVMKNFSANLIAGLIWNEDGLGTAEWLHRSAYSYGGLEGLNADSSQTIGNLVFGTYECNTAMIRFESYIKRLVDHGPKDFDVILVTGVKAVAGWGNPTWSWLVPQLTYAWTFAAPDFPTYHIGKEYTFDLCSRKYPTLFEVELDEAFDSHWWGTKANVKLRESLSLFLLMTQLVP